jgi:hypothetical protein
MKAQFRAEKINRLKSKIMSCIAVSFTWITETDYQV